jgi:hypothetical protein
MGERVLRLHFHGPSDIAFTQPYRGSQACLQDAQSQRDSEPNERTVIRQLLCHRSSNNVSLPAAEWNHRNRHR